MKELEFFELKILLLSEVIDERFYRYLLESIIWKSYIFFLSPQRVL